MLCVEVVALSLQIKPATRSHFKQPGGFQRGRVSTQPKSGQIELSKNPDALRVLKLDRCLATGSSRMHCDVRRSVVAPMNASDFHSVVPKGDWEGNQFDGAHRQGIRR